MTNSNREWQRCEDELKAARETIIALKKELKEANQRPFWSGQTIKHLKELCKVLGATQVPYVLKTSDNLKSCVRECVYLAKVKVKP